MRTGRRTFLASLGATAALVVAEGSGLTKWAAPAFVRAENLEMGAPRQRARAAPPSPSLKLYTFGGVWDEPFRPAYNAPFDPEEDGARLAAYVDGLKDAEPMTFNLAPSTGLGPGGRVYVQGRDIGVGVTDGLKLAGMDDALAALRELNAGAEAVILPGGWTLDVVHERLILP